MKERTVLFVDDEENILKTVRRQLELNGLTVFTASNSQEALAILEKEKIPVVISDQRMPNMPGSELLSIVKERYPKTIRMIISGYTDFDALQEAVNKGEIFKFIPKPWEEGDLMHSLEKAYECYNEQEKKEKKNRVLDNALEGVAITNEQDNIDSVNLSFLLVTGFDKEEVTNHNVWDLFPQFTANEKQDILDELVLNNVWQGEASLKMKNKSLLGGILSISEIIDNIRDSKYHSFSFMSIPELQQKEIQLEKNIQNDPQTNLLNRSGFEAKLTSLLFSSKAPSLFVATFYFAKFDSISHILGSNLSLNIILQLGDRLKQTLGNGDIAGRISENAFSIVTSNIASKEEMLNYLLEIKGAFDIPLDIHQHSVILKPFIGISVFPQDANDSTKLIDFSLLSCEYAAQNCYDEIFYSNTIDHQMKMNFREGARS